MNNGYTIIENKYITSSLSDGAYRLYSLLTSMCFGDKDNCYPSQNTLSKVLNKSVRTIQRYLAELIEHNLIVKKRRGSISNIYTVLAKKGKKVASTIKNKVNTILQRNSNSKIDPPVGNNNTYYKKKKVDNFNNYEQRPAEYYLNLENKLLGWE